jgi:hypothetical protein
MVCLLGVDGFALSMLRRLFAVLDWKSQSGSSSYELLRTHLLDRQAFVLQLVSEPLHVIL